MNTKIKINLNNFEKARNFISVAGGFESDIDTISRHYVIDAKSILGIFTLDLSKDIEVEIHSDNEEEIKKFNNEMENFKTLQK